MILNSLFAAWFLFTWSSGTGPAADGYVLSYADKNLDVGKTNSISLDLDPKLTTEVRVKAYNSYGQSTYTPVQVVGVAECPDGQRGINSDKVDVCAEVATLGQFKRDCEGNLNVYTTHYHACMANAAALDSKANTLSTRLTKEKERVKKILKACGSKCKGM